MGLKEQDKASCVNFWRQFLDLVDNEEGRDYGRSDHVR